MMKKLLKLTCKKKTFMFSVFGLLFGIGSVNAQTCNEPTISANPATICSGMSATLTAVSDGEEVFWYASESATSSIGEGTSFTTPILTSDTSYWVESVNYGAPGTGTIITGGARVAPSSNSGSAVVAASAPWGLVFDAYEDFVLNSVDVFITAPAGGDIVINLLDNNWNVMETTSLTLPAGGSTSSPLQHTITLDFDVPQGNGYRLVASSSPAMVREFSSGHPGFPYSIGTVGAVTAGSINTTGTNPTVYYFFYNWTVTAGTPPEECVSDRIEVLVTVSPLPTLPGGDSTQAVEEGSLISDLVVTGQNLTWYADADLTQEIPDTTELMNGATYYVTQTVGDCTSAVLAITVTFIDPCEDVTEPNGDSEQTAEEGSLLSDLVVTGQNLTWYADADLTQEIPDTTELVNSTTYYVTQTVGDCTSDALAITVTLIAPCSDITAPDGDSEQTAEEGSLLSDLVVTGQNLTWYADADLTQEIPDTTELVNGTTYYVTQTVGDCTSDALAITVTVTLDVDNFNKYHFNMYPNPVSDVLNLKANQEISNIEVFNLLGQKMDVPINNNQLDMTLLLTGNYILNVTIEGITKTFKVSRR